VTATVIGSNSRVAPSVGFDVQPLSTGTELQVVVPDSQVTVLDAIEQRAEAARAGSVQA
jgi:hypothetical protein